MSFSFPNVVMGLLGLALGVWMVKEAYHINHHILFLGWVENKWGPGMGTVAYQLLGVAICLFSLMVTMGYIDLYGAAFGGRPVNGVQSSGSNGLVPQNNFSPSGERTRIID